MGVYTKVKLQIKQKQAGFTIVELLIVIVVIAILAAVSVVAYSGIQERARNTQIISSLNAYLKLFSMYKSEHGEFPMQSAPNVDESGAAVSYHNKLYCLMPASSVPTGYTPYCGGFGGDEGVPSDVIISGGAANTPNRMQAFEGLISQYLSSDLPNTYTERPMAYTSGAVSQRRFGAYYVANRYSSGTTVSYMLYGNQQCPNPPVGEIQYEGYNSSKNVTTCVILLAPYTDV